MSDASDPRARRRLGRAVALLVIGLLVAFVPALVAGDRFLLDPYQASIAAWDQAIPSSANATLTYGTVGTSHYGFGGTSSEASVSADTFVVNFGPPTSLSDLVSSDIAWAIPAATLLLVPGLFLWWRRSAVTFGRIAGAASAIAASSVVCALVLTRDWNEFVPPGWIWVSVPLGGALMAAAFVVAPAPRVRDE